MCDKKFHVVLSLLCLLAPDAGNATVSSIMKSHVSYIAWAARNEEFLFVDDFFLIFDDSVHSIAKKTTFDTEPK